MVRPDIPLTEREKKLFASEADATARLADHPYIVSVMNAGTTDDGRPYLVMRYCPPPDLGVRVRGNPMPVAEAISTGIKLASAIETAHRSGILHRDIKPSNVLVTSYSEPALTDFGIAGRMHEVDVRQRCADLLPLVAARAAGRSLERLGRLRRLRPGRHDLAPAGRTVAVLDPQRRQLHPRAHRADPARRSRRPPSAPTSRRPSTACSSSAWPSSRRTARRARSSWPGACSASRPPPASRAP